MSFDKLIIKNIVNVTKNSIKIEERLNLLKEEIYTYYLSQFKNILNSFPFDIDPLLKGKSFDINNLKNVIPLNISENEKKSKEIILNEFEDNLKILISTKNLIQKPVSNIYNNLSNLETLSNTLEKTITGIKGGVTLIKTLPIPSSVPPGVGIPLGVINTFSDTLDLLKQTIDKIDGPLKQIPEVINKIKNILNILNIKLEELDLILNNILNIVIFLKLKYTLINEEEIELQYQDFNIKTNKIIDLENDLNVNILDRLNPSSSNPLIYKDFILNIEYNKDNKFSTPLRRIKATNNKIVLFSPSSPNNPYSYSSSIDVLINDIKFNIDQYLLQNN